MSILSEVHWDGQLTHVNSTEARHKMQVLTTQADSVMDITDNIYATCIFLKSCIHDSTVNLVEVDNLESLGIVGEQTTSLHVVILQTL